MQIRGVAMVTTPIFLDNRATFFFATLFPLFNSELSCSTAFEEFLIPIII